ncbi:MAG: sigma-70 family RNA polymerase sigma factor, partial [Eubacterium sp.]
DVNATGDMLNVIHPMLCINQFGEDGSADFDIPVDDSENLFDRLSLSQIIDTLDSDEKKLIDYRFYKGQTQSVTANSLGISQVQVSRKEKAVLRKLRERLNN